MKLLDKIPKNDGFHMPGEYESHASCWMLWPERTDNWRDGARPAQQAFTAVATAISRFEPVTVGVNQRQYDNAKNMLPENIRVIEMSSDDAWMRDCGPTFVKNNEGIVRGIDWVFNAWGGLVDGLFFPWDKDDQVANKVCAVERKYYYRTKNFVLEGGSIHSDGDGTVITTEGCLLSKGRNPSMSKDEIDHTLCQYLGCDKVIWLKRGIYKDETNGHVDNICCFARPGVVLLAWTDDESDPQYEISQENYEILSNTVDSKGRQLEIHKIHTPKPVIITKQESEGVDSVDGTLPRAEGTRMAASYVNFYIANGGIVMPLFNDEKDEAAMAKIRELFPNREVVGIYAREILLGGGNIHCITQQLPK